MNLEIERRFIAKKKTFMSNCGYNSLNIWTLSHVDVVFCRKLELRSRMHVMIVKNQAHGMGFINVNRTKAEIEEVPYLEVKFRVAHR